jgi:hypothetical protein
MAVRDGSKIISKIAAKTAPSEEPVEERLGHRKRPETGRVLGQVDRQTKSSFPTYEAAEKVGMGIKQGHPTVQVVVYDALEAVDKMIELPQS